MHDVLDTFSFFNVSREGVLPSFRLCGRACILSRCLCNTLLGYDSKAFKRYAWCRLPRLNDPSLSLWLSYGHGMWGSKKKHRGTNCFGQWPSNLRCRSKFPKACSKLRHVHRPLLDETERRFCLFPTKHKDIWDYYKKLESTLWTSADISLDQDVVDYRTKLTDNERHYVDKVLAFSQVRTAL